MTLIDFRGTRYTVRELADMAGVKRSTLYQRLKAGWTAEQTVTTPTPTQRRAGMTSTLDRPAEGQTDRLDLDQTPGVPSDLGPLMGTGAGSTARETTNITFPVKAETE